MGRGSRGRGRGSVGDHPEDEEDFYEEEMEVSSPPVPGESGGLVGAFGGNLGNSGMKASGGSSLRFHIRFLFRNRGNLHMVQNWKGTKAVKTSPHYCCPPAA